MKAIGSLRSSNATGGGVALAAFLGPDGMISTLEGCMARMVDVRIGEDNARVLALIPETELLRTDLTEFDWCERWNRLRVYRAPDESPEQVVASDRVEQILAKTLKEYLEDADPPAADNPSVVDEVFWQAFGGTDPEMTELTEGLELEIGGERELEAEERENLLTVVPTDWVPIILNSRPPLQYFDAEALRVPEATEGCWRRHPFPAGFGLGFVASVATVALSGLVVYLTNAQDTTGESWLRFWHHLGIGGFSDPATTFSSIMFDTGNTTASTSSNSTASSSTASSSTASSSTTSSSTTSSSTTSSTTTTAAPLDNALVSVLVKSRLLNANVNDVTTLISKSELAELTVGMEVCEKAAAVVNSNEWEQAAIGGWKKFSWQRCNQRGCKLICRTPKKLTCYYFGAPFKYDFPTIFDAVVLYEKPSKCAAQPNDKVMVDEARILKFSRIAKEVAGSIPGIDLNGVSDAKLVELGEEVSKYLRINETCSFFNPRGCQHIALPGCSCARAVFDANFDRPETGLASWGRVMDFNTVLEALLQYYTAYKRFNHTVDSCSFQCYQPRRNMPEAILAWWKTDRA